MSKQRDFIRNFMAVLDTTELSGVNALNEAVKICTKSKFTTLQALVDQMVADCRQTNDAEKFLQDYCGIDLTNEDTGAITGADAGGSIVKTAESVIPEVGSLQIYTKDSFTTRGGSFKLDKSYSSLTESEKFIWHALYTWWIPNALDLIAESYGKNYNLKDNTMTIHFKNLGYGTLASANSSILNINTEYYGNIDTSNVNGSANTSYTSYLDRVISHELTHSVMFKESSSFVPKLMSSPQFIMEGMAELTHGIDDERTYEIRSIAGNADSLKSALNVNDHSTLWSPAYSGGYMFLRYFAKQFSDLGLEFTSGNDFYANYESKKTLNALGGNDNVNNFSSDKVKIYGANGNDTIYSSDSNSVTIDGGKGNDSIFSSENKKSKIYGGAGKDTIENTGNYVTLSGGSSNDSIKNVSKYYDYSGHKAGNYVKIYGGTGKDTIENTGNYVTLSGGSGNDSIKNVGKYYDYLNSKYDKAGNYVKIYGGTGEDSIYSSGSEVTITGGASKDYISLSSYDSENNVIQYASGDGNDTIFGFNSDDTFHITKGSYSAKADGNDVILSIGKGSVRFVNALYTPIKVKTAKGKIETVSSRIDNTKDNTVVSGTSANETISNSGSNVTITGGAGNDSIYSSGSNVKIYGGNGKDTIKNYYDSKVTISGGAGNDTIENYSGSKVKIFGDSGNDTIYSSGANVTITGGTGKDYISLSSYGSENNVIQYAEGDGNDTIYGFNSDDLLHITKGTYTTGLYGSDFIIKVGKQTVTLKDVADDKNLKVKVKGSKGKVSTYDDWKNVFGTSGNDYLTNYEDKLTVDGKAGNDSIYSSGANVTITGGADNDSISNSGSKVKIFGDSGNDSIYSSGANVTITGGTGKDYISLSSYGSENNVIQYAEGDGNDTIYGFNSDDTFHITKGSYSAKADGNDVILSIGKGSVRFVNALYTPIKVKTAKGKIETVSLRMDNTKNNTVVSGTSANETISNSGSNVTITGGAGNDSISNSGSEVTISGGTGNDSISSYGSNVTITGGAGNDSISNSGSEVTISGGTGNDSISSYGSENNVIQYAEGDGNDTIYGFDFYDTFHITKGDYTVTSSENDVILKIGKGSVKFKDAIDTSIRVKLANGDITTVYGGSTIDTQTGGGDGGTGTQSGSNVTISGDAGNDTLTSGSGYDVLTYSSGNDIITDYQEDNNRIRFDGATIQSRSTSGNDVIFTTNQGRLTIKNARSKEIDIIGDTSTDSSSKNVSELWLAEENNFVSSDNLSSITKNNLTPTSLEKIETNNFENLTQENNLITYSNK